MVQDLLLPAWHSTGSVARSGAQFRSVRNQYRLIAVPEAVDSMCPGFGNPQRHVERPNPAAPRVTAETDKARGTHEKKADKSGNG